MCINLRPIPEPEKTGIERTEEIRELHEVVTDFAEAVSELIPDVEDEYGNVYSVSIELPIDNDDDDDTEDDEDE